MNSERPIVNASPIDGRFSYRWIAWLSMLAITVGACSGYAASTDVFDAPSIWRVIFFLLAGVSGALAVWLMPQASGWRGWLLVLLPAIVLRIAIFPTAPSDDVNRYLWEGRLVIEGVSPYGQTADDPALEEYRDAFWQGMNHRDKATAYPPITLFGFAAIGAVEYAPSAFKCVFLLTDLLVVAGILALLARRGMSLSSAGFYAFSPLSLVAFAGEGHFDVWMLAALVWALWFYETGRSRMAISLLALATGIKWVTAPLLPFFLRGRWLVGIGLAALVLGLPAIYFWADLVNLMKGVLSFGGTSSFNGPIYDSLHLGLGWSRGVSVSVVLALFATVVIWRWLGFRRASLEAHIQWVFGALVVLSPTVHFWYIAWILPFVCLRPSLPWLLLSWSSGVYFFVWINQASGAGWGLSTWQSVAFWAPFFLGCIYELWSTRGRVVWPKRRVTSASTGVSVVIPVQGYVPELKDAFASVAAQTSPVMETILVDSEQSSELIHWADTCGSSIRVIQADRGRGQQIAAGISAASGEWVLVLHGDAQLAKRSVESVLKAGASDPCLLGGALGQRFVEQSWGLLGIELLNDFRAGFTRTAFGDQVQFFHRASAEKYTFMPRQPLMEDVEASWRLRESGTCRYLHVPSTVSARKWLKMGWCRRVRLVLSLLSRYRWVRLRGRSHAEQLSQQLYQEYYPQSDSNRLDGSKVGLK